MGVAVPTIKLSFRNTPQQKPVGVTRRAGSAIGTDYLSFKYG
jgi:hypothetical protein